LRSSASRLLQRAFVLTLALQAGGCATTEFFKQLDSAELQRRHRTMLVVLNHSPLKYYWEITREGSTYRYQMRKGSYPGVPPVWQSTADEERDSAEVAYARFPSLAPVTRELYQKTFERSLSSRNYLQLQPEFLILTDTTVQDPSAPDTLLQVEIPNDSAGGTPEWFLVLEVTDIGLMRTGIRTGGGLAGALAGLLTTALSEKQWYVWLSCRLRIADAHSKRILWKDWAGFRQPLQGNLQELLKSKQETFMKGLVVALGSTAAKQSADLLNNRLVAWDDTSMTRLLLPKDEIDSLTARLMAPKL
jgi:hypothetical protein